MSGRELTAARRRDLIDLSKRLGVRFNNLAYLDMALTHSSYANEAEAHRINISHNERLEYLGDAVLELASSDYLFRRFPELSEGDLSKQRAFAVCEASLSRRALAVGLGDYLLLGHGEKLTGGDRRPSILADAFEAVIGAVYLDQGWPAAANYVVEQLGSVLVTIDTGKRQDDYKSILQELTQRHHNQRVVYELLAAEGPDHAKIFTVCVRINGLAYGTGKGKTKKEAEQQAAAQALIKLKH